VELKTTYQEMKDRYPKSVEDVISKVEKSRSKLKKIVPSKWEWEISWCVLIPSMNLGDTFANITNKTEEKADAEWRANKSKSVCERLLEKVSGVSAMIGTKGYRSKINSIPVEIRDINKKYAKEEYEEDKRLLSLTKEELNAETNDLLGQLHGSPGFTAIGIARKQ